MDPNIFYLYDVWSETWKLKSTPSRLTNPHHNPDIMCHFYLFYLDYIFRAIFKGNFMHIYVLSQIP